MARAAASPIAPPIRERQSELYRLMGRTKEADVIDAELLKLLAVADLDHAVLLRLKARQVAAGRLRLRTGSKDSAMSRQSRKPCDTRSAGPFRTAIVDVESVSDANGD